MSLLAERKTNVSDSNAKAVSSHGRIITKEISGLSDKLDEFIRMSRQSTHKLQTDAQQYRTKELEALTNQYERIDHQLQKLRDSVETIRAEDDISSEAFDSMQQAIRAMQDNLRSTVTTWSEALQVSWDAMRQELLSSTLSNFTMVSHLDC